MGRAHSNFGSHALYAVSWQEEALHNFLGTKKNIYKGMRPTLFFPVMRSPTEALAPTYVFALGELEPTGLESALLEFTNEIMDALADTSAVSWKSKEFISHGVWSV